jgi:hypothetical protein
MIEPNEASREVGMSSRRSFLERSAIGAGAGVDSLVAVFHGAPRRSCAAHAQ